MALPVPDLAPDSAPNRQSSSSRNLKPESVGPGALALQVCYCRTSPLLYLRLGRVAGGLASSSIEAKQGCEQSQHCDHCGTSMLSEVE